jgi:2,3-bisphosphoglycerate-independent phosphoglycerate mutase
MEKSYPMADAVRAAYLAGQEDESLLPLVRVDAAGQPVGSIQGGDYVIFYDIRGEREVELTSAFTGRDFAHFERPPMRVHFATMIEYHPDLDVQVAFPPPGRAEDTLSEVVSKAGLKQAKVVESEKAIHVSFFLNGKELAAFPGEQRIVVESPRPTSHSGMPPQMSAAAVADAAIEALRDPAHTLVTVNLCNVDVIGHIEDPDAIRVAVETVDAQAGRIVEAARAAGVTVVLTADHGTVERWYYPDGTIDTGHTDSPVPFVVIDPGLGQAAQLCDGGALTDVAPTVLQLLSLPTPGSMTGHSLLMFPPPKRERRVLLLILDGWGLGDGGPGDLIAQAHTPVMDQLRAEWPNTQLTASGLAVGMPPGTVGNSEACTSAPGVSCPPTGCASSNRWPTARSTTTRRFCGPCAAQNGTARACTCWASSRSTAPTARWITCWRCWRWPAARVCPRSISTRCWAGAAKSRRAAPFTSSRWSARRSGWVWARWQRSSAASGRWTARRTGSASKKRTGCWWRGRGSR